MPDASRLSRRAVLAAGGSGVLAASACGRDGGAPPRPAADEPDEALLAEVVAEVSAVAALTGRIPDLTAMHAAHLAALEAEAPSVAAASRRRVRRTEEGLRDFLVDAAMRAESGPLARLLASMSASVGQHLAALPRESP